MANSGGKAGDRIVMITCGDAHDGKGGIEAWKKGKEPRANWPGGQFALLVSDLFSRTL